jgi:osmotically-inducible protein OsmY
LLNVTIPSPWECSEGIEMSAPTTVSTSLPAADERLAQMVILAIRQRGPRSAHGLTVLAHQSVVTLRGAARSFYERQLLLHTAQRVPGVRQIVDEIEVVPSHD